MKTKNTVLSIVFLLGFFYSQASAEGKTDMLIFSYDRPLQVWAFLESVEEYVKGLNTIYLLYRTTSNDFAQGYQEVKRRFPKVKFYKQRENPRLDFKPLVLKSSFDEKSSSTHLVIACDDDIVKDEIDLNECVKALEDAGAYGFYFRIGKNTTENFMIGYTEGLPPLQEVAPSMYRWQFQDGKGAWRYPNSVLFTLYAKESLKEPFHQLSYYSPNIFESRWARLWGDLTKFGLCYETSKVVNIPMNLVQQDFLGNRHNNTFTTQELLAIFNVGLKMDRRPLRELAHDSAFIDYEPRFVKREKICAVVDEAG